MREHYEFSARLTDKDAVAACAFANQIVRESRESDCWYLFFDEIAALLRHKNALVRNRAISILAANAHWDTACKIDCVMDELLSHVTDEKSITARRCIKALPEIAAAKPNLIPRIRAALENADLTGYRDSMQPLILKDIASALQQLAEQTADGIRYTPMRCETHRADCPCNRTRCPRHGDCIACREHHAGNRNPIFCQRPAYKKK